MFKEASDYGIILCTGAVMSGNAVESQTNGFGKFLTKLNVTYILYINLL